MIIQKFNKAAKLCITETTAHQRRLMPIFEKSYQLVLKQFGQNIIYRQKESVTFTGCFKTEIIPFD